MPLGTSRQSLTTETPTTSPYNPSLGIRAMLDSALMSTFPDIFTPLEMLMVPPGKKMIAHLEFLGQPRPNKHVTSSYHIKDEIRHILS